MLKNLCKYLGIAVAVMTAAVSCKDDKPEVGPASIGTSTNTVTFTKEGGSLEIKVLSNRDWNATLPEDVDWLVVEPAAGTASSDSVTVRLTALSNTGEDRRANVTFATSTLTATVQVVQPGEIERQFTSISDVRAYYNGENITIVDEWSVCGTVISNYRHSDNGGLNNATSMKTMIIQDETAGISLYLAENNSTYAVGDVLEIKLQGLELQRYNGGALQVNGVPAANITFVSSGSQVEPVTISAAQLLTGEYESQYVAVENVQVVDSDLGKTFVQNSSHTSINFTGQGGERFVLFSSSYSVYGSETVPEGSGTLKGIAAVYGGSTYQISITSRDDYAGLTGARFDVTADVSAGIIGDYDTWNGVGPLASFGDDFSGITSSNVAYESTNWLFYSSDGSNLNYNFKTGTYNTDKYIQIAPYNSAADQVVAYALPPRADMTQADPKTFTFRKALYHLDNSADNSKLEVVVSTDFTGNFETATWTVVKDASFAEGATRNEWVEESVDLSSYSSAASLCIALRYTGKSNTYRIDDVKYGSGDIIDPGLDPGTGDDDKENVITGTAGDGVYTSSIDLKAESVISTDDKYYTDYTFTIGGTGYPAVKLGTSSVAGSYSFNLGTTGSCTLSMYAIAWNNRPTNAKVVISGGGTINGFSEVELALNSNSSLAGSETTLEITFGNDFYSMNIEGATENTVITVTTSGMTATRVAFTGVNVK